MATSSIPALGDTTDAEKKEYSIVHFEYPPSHGIKKISTSYIYKQTLFSRLNFLKPYGITKKEENIYVDKHKDVYLLSRDDIRRLRSKYQFIHIGLVQFSIEYYALSRGNVSVSLRDSKYPSLQESMLVSFDSDVHEDDIIKFNWFPNFSASLTDLAYSNGLVVTIDSSAYARLRYKVCYKLMKKSLKPDYLFENPVLEVNTDTANVVVHKSDNGS